MRLDGRQRAATLAALQAEEWDLLVIGGGITGVGIALDAATRGMRVALVEMQDYGAGTSSRSTKLIHGGLRYLKNLEFGIVREVGQERAILHRNANHIVLSEKMLLPVVEGGTFGKVGLWFGLWLYDLLAGVKREEKRVMLNVEETVRKVPFIGKKSLKGAGFYSEYRTDDARLVIEVLKTAVAHGACALNYAEVAELSYDAGKLMGAVIADRIGGGRVTVKAKQVVNAAGPWVDGIRDKDGSLKGKRLHHTKGVHLVVPHKRLPLDVSMYFDVGDGRMIFAIPRHPWTYFGTTDTNYQGSLDHPRATAADVTYLVGAVNRMFPDAGIVQSDIVSSWAGVRPLIHEDGKSPSQLSRKDELFFSDSGLITIAGGKLTGFRKMAEKVVDEVVKRMDGKFGGCKTAEIALSGSGSRDWNGTGRLEMEAKEAAWLVGLYGMNAVKVVELGGGNDKMSALRGALRYSIREEGVAQLADFFVRRSALLYFGRPWIEASLATASAVFQEEFGTDYDMDRGGVFAVAYKDAVTFE